MKLDLDHLTFQEIDSLDKITGLRSQYLDQLSEAQELYLDMLIRLARRFVIQYHDHPVGYFLISEGSTLLEYYIVPEHLTQADALLEKIIHAFAVRRALCKTFDPTLLSCCAHFQKKMGVGGILFREYHPTPALTGFENITVRMAVSADQPMIAAINVEVYDREEDIIEDILNQRVFIFEKGVHTIGFGLCSRIRPGHPEHDIGMLVDVPFQRQGYGEFIIRWLVRHCEQNGWRPVCGCAAENTVSRRTLEKAGFVSRHRLLWFELGV